MNRSRWSLRLTVVLSLLATGILSGCLPEGMPAYVDGGKSVVTTTDGMLWVYTVASGDVKGYKLPASDMSGKMLGDQIWVHSPEHRARFDWNKKEFVGGPKELDGLGVEGDWVAGATEGTWEGKPCVFVLEKRPENPGEQSAYGIYALPELKKLKAVDAIPLAAGDLWSVTETFARDPHAGDKLTSVELFDASGKSVVKVAAEELKQFKGELLHDPNESWRQMQGYVGDYARLSPDKTVLLLALVSHGDTRFDVLDVKTGKVLWGTMCPNPIRGHPLVTRDGIWALANGEKGVALLRYRKDGKGISTKPHAESSPETILEYPLGGKEFEVSDYNLSPDGKEFVAAINGASPRLLFVPIKEGVTAKDVQVIELK